MGMDVRSKVKRDSQFWAGVGNRQNGPSDHSGHRYHRRAVEGVIPHGGVVPQETEGRGLRLGATITDAGDLQRQLPRQDGMECPGF